jgi:hypothetical protein
MVILITDKFIRYEENFNERFRLEMIHWEYLLFAFLLMPVNWFFELLKFNQFSHLDKKYSKVDLIKSLLSGIAFSAITPLKSGDYGGRLIWLKQEDWPAALSAIFWGNWCQLLWLMAIGIGGVNYLTFIISAPLFPVSYFFMGMIIFVILLLIIFWFYARIELFRKLFQYTPFKQKIKELYIGYLKISNRKDLYKALIYAGLRYFTYVIQYMLLLCVFDNKLPIGYLFFGVVSVFFIQSILPVLSWMGLIGRTGIAIFVLSKLGVSELDSSLSSILLWIINILLPSLIGLYFIVVKFLNKSYGKQEMDIG